MGRRNIEVSKLNKKDIWINVKFRKVRLKERRDAELKRIFCHRLHTY